jgi:hypothetical protein
MFPNCQKDRLEATTLHTSRKPVHIPRRRCPALPSGGHWSGATPGTHCHYILARVTSAISFGSSLLPVRLIRRDTGRRSEIISAFSPKRTLVGCWSSSVTVRAPTPQRCAGGCDGIRGSSGASHCPAGPNLPRLRALALFGRGPLQRVEGVVMPASKNPVLWRKRHRGRAMNRGGYPLPIHSKVAALRLGCPRGSGWFRFKSERTPFWTCLIVHSQRRSFGFGESSPLGIPLFPSSSLRAVQRISLKHIRSWQ